MLPPMASTSGTGPADVWAVGLEGSVQHFDGTAWMPSPSGTTDNLRGVWALAPDDAWAVGAHGTMLHWDGMAWQ